MTPLHSSGKTSTNKKVLLRERKRHTTRRVASARGGGGTYLGWGYLTWTEGTYLAVPPPPMLTDRHLWKHNLPSYYVLVRACLKLQNTGHILHTAAIDFGDLLRGFGDFIPLASAANLGDLGDFGDTLPLITNVSVLSLEIFVMSASFSGKTFATVEQVSVM